MSAAAAAPSISYAQPQYIQTGAYPQHQQTYTVMAPQPGVQYEAAPHYQYAGAPQVTTYAAPQTVSYPAPEFGMPMEPVAVAPPGYGHQPHLQYVYQQPQYEQPQVIYQSQPAEQPQPQVIYQSMPSHGGHEVVYQDVNGNPVVYQEAPQVVGQQPQLFVGPDGQYYMAQPEAELVPGGAQYVTQYAQPGTEQNSSFSYRPAGQAVQSMPFSQPAAHVQTLAPQAVQIASQAPQAMQVASRAGVSVHSMPSGPPGQPQVHFPQSGPQVVPIQSNAFGVASQSQPAYTLQSQPAYVVQSQAGGFPMPQVLYAPQDQGQAVSYVAPVQVYDQPGQPQMSFAQIQSQAQMPGQAVPCVSSPRHPGQQVGSISPRNAHQVQSLGGQGLQQIQSLAPQAMQSQQQQPQQPQVFVGADGQMYQLPQEAQPQQYYQQPASQYMLQPEGHPAAPTQSYFGGPPQQQLIYANVNGQILPAEPVAAFPNAQSYYQPGLGGLYPAHSMVAYPGLGQFGALPQHQQPAQQPAQQPPSTTQMQPQAAAAAQSSAAPAPVKSVNTVVEPAVTPEPSKASAPSKSEKDKKESTKDKKDDKKKTSSSADKGKFEKDSKKKKTGCC